MTYQTPEVTEVGRADELILGDVIDEEKDDVGGLFYPSTAVELGE